ncbi:hypothetical protein PTKIN_Ptkin01aG0323400 [Pterospermum kingtungense]
MNNQEEEAVSVSGLSSQQDSNRCPICLSPLVMESYVDTCFHKFCFNCIEHWSRVVSSKRSRPSASVKCPLCKCYGLTNLRTENFSIISGFDGTSFQRHYINQDFGDRYLLFILFIDFL